MIKPLSSFSNSTFKGGMEQYLKQTKEGIQPTYHAYVNNENVPKKSIKEGFADIAKGYNSTKGYIFGAAKGLASGVLFGGITGVVAKNIKEDKNIFKVIGGSIKDIGTFALKVIKFAPKIITKSPVDNMKTMLKVPKKYFSKYLTKENKSAAVVSIAVGVGALAYNIVKAKIKANRQNADVDHSLNIRH